MLGENIKRIREEKKIGLNETARLAGISGSYLSNIEKGIKTNPSMESVTRIAFALNVSVDDLFREDGPAMDIDQIIKENDKLEKEMQELYPKIAKLSPDERKKLMKMIDILLEENNPQK